MPITRTPMVDDDGSGTTGTIFNNAWKTELYNQIDALMGNSGVWVAVPYLAGNFTGSGSMVWTVTAGNQTTYQYMVIGRTVYVQLTLTGTSVTVAAGSPFNVTLPAGFTPTKSNDGVFFALDNGVATTGRLRIIATDGAVHLYRLDGANWVGSAANTSVSLQFFYSF